MAMISCPECGREVSDRAAACPQCGCPIAPGSPSSAPTLGAHNVGIPQHLTKSALLARFPPVTDVIPAEIRKEISTAEEILYFNYVARKGGCGSPKAAQQWIMVTTARVAYHASIAQTQGASAAYGQSSGSIPLSQISFVGMTKRGTQAGCGCAGVGVCHLEIRSSGGSIVIAMPTEAHVIQAKQFLEAVLNPR